ncbi:hypothetical protein PIB30_050073, partial [Stylosanthes scabra]|nr:hypothetical protein [Stylosanthes scabra]
AVKAITTINGTTWDDAKLYATMSRSKSDGTSERTSNTYVKQQGQKHGIVKKWVAVESKNRMETNGKTNDKQAEHSYSCCTSMKSRTQEVEAIWCDEQKQRLRRSLLRVSVKPIEFRKVMYKLLEEWKGPGGIECRDVGPFKCLLTFDTTETRDAALEDDLLLSVFDEVRPHWETFWSLSRRVWIDIMGLPIGLRSNENLNRIAKLWGKLVRLDDRTKGSKSFSTARILVDCYQWERVHEWVSMRIEDKQFDVFVKEFDLEVYSVQSHPDLGSESLMSLDALNTTSVEEVKELKTWAWTQCFSKPILRRLGADRIKPQIMKRVVGHLNQTMDLQLDMNMGLQHLARTRRVLAHALN